jgi:hypothetical protein
MYYNQLSNQWSEIPMPLLMGFTNPEPIQSAVNEEPIIYDPVYQIVYDMREIGTKCLKTTQTYKVRGSSASSPDKKNEIDDTKRV